MMGWQYLLDFKMNVITVEASFLIAELAMSRLQNRQKSTRMTSARGD
jgi:hypothetical protein